MNKIYTFGLLLFLISTTLTAQITKHALFLGNSYTAVNNLPQLTASLSLSAGDSLVYNQNTPGGYTLQGHSTNAVSLSLIQQGSWDYVILQEQSQKPSWPISQVISDVFPYAESLSNSIRAANPCATPLFYMTWGRKNGDINNCANWPPVCSYEGMDSLLNLRYRMMADSNAAYVSPVGAVWRYIRSTNNKIELYAADESHPSLAGSYAAACTFYTLIFQKDPMLITSDYGLDGDVALDIRSAAKLIAYDSLSKWNIGKFLPEAHFAASQVNDSVHFSNQSLYANNYHWNFGDGNSSTLFEPHHKYANSGAYHVQLEVTKCGKTDTTSVNIQVLPTSIIQAEQTKVNVYPNPIGNEINIQLDKYSTISNVQVYSTDGKRIMYFDSMNGKNIKLETQNLSKGVYILSFELDTQKYQFRLVK